MPCGLTPTQMKRRWEANNKERRAEIVRNYRARKPASQMLANAKARAKKLGLPFNLTLDDIVIPKVCPILGIRLRTGGEGGQRDEAPSLDRKVPELGYTKGNVVVTSMRANRLKSDGTVAEMRALAVYYSTYTRETPDD